MVLEGRSGGRDSEPGSFMDGAHHHKLKDTCWHSNSLQQGTCSWSTVDG